MKASSQKEPNYFLKFLSIAANTILRTLWEIFDGIAKNRINWLYCMTFVVFSFTAYRFALDLKLAKYMGFGLSYVKNPWIAHTLHIFTGSFGFLSWGLREAFRMAKDLDHLKESLINAGLKNSLGQLPKYVSDGFFDNSTKMLTMSSASIPLEKFRAKKEALEAGLRVYIDEIRERRGSGLIEVLYAYNPLPKYLETTEAPKKQPFIYPIGQTRGKKISVDFRQSPHLLVAGTSGGGKSTLLRNIITSLYLNHKSASFVLIDLKEGTEFQIFEDLERVDVVNVLKDTMSRFSVTSREMTDRMEAIRSNKCKDIDEYNQMCKESNNKLKPMGRIFLVIDEASEFGLSTEKDKSEIVVEAKKALSRIARMGRACGVHLILGTQRPDVRSIDPQVKANLSSIVCFAVPNTATSMTILSNSKAASIPKDIKGRAVWKDGLWSTPIQTPFISSENINKWLEKFRKDKEAKESIDSAQGLDKKADASPSADPFDQGD